MSQAVEAGSAAARQRTVLVLGMHRSGTSLLAQVLDRAGVFLGDDLMPADPHNPDGYFEDLEIVTVHDRLLAALDRPWGSVKTALPLPDGWLEHPAAAEARTELTALVRRRLAAGHALWGFKDPRTCRLLPLWLALLGDIDTDVVLLLSNRAPAEVARSLAKRDTLPPRFAELLWLVHVLDILRVAGDRIAAVVDWDRWFADPQGQVPGLADALGLEPQRLGTAVAETVKPALRRQRSEETAAVPLARQVHAALAGWAQGGTPPADIARWCERLDDALSTAAGWADVALGPDWPAEVYRRDAEINRLTGERDRLQVAFDEYRAAYDRDVVEVKAACDRAIAEALARYDRDVGAYRAAHEEAMAAYRAVEKRLEEIPRLEAMVTGLRADEAAAVAASRDLLAELLTTPGLRGVPVPEVHTVQQALAHVRSVVHSARWAVSWPLRRGRSPEESAGS